MGETNAGKHLSRRGFLRSSAVALGTVAACNVEGLSSAAQGSGAKTVAPEDLKESAMPHVIIKMYPGRSEQQKRRLAEAVVKDVVAIAGIGEDSGPSQLRKSRQLSGPRRSISRIFSRTGTRYTRNQNIEPG